MTQDDKAMSAASRGSHVGLRDRFAAAALTGLLARREYDPHSLHQFSRASYDMADAMLRERGNHLPDGQSTLTDAEREAIARLCEAVAEYSDIDRKANGCHADDDMAAVDVARGLLERLG
jgi:hypothetical protein